MINMFADVQNLRTSLDAVSQEQVEAFKHVATTRSLGRIMWMTLGLSVMSVLILVGLIFVSFVTLEVGVPFWISSYPSNFMFIQTCFSVLMVGVCLWMFLENNLDHLLILVFVLLLYASWDLVVAFYGGVDLVKLILGFFGLFQLGYAFQVFRISQNISESQPSSLFPEPQLKQQYDSIWKAMVKSKTALDCSRLEVVPNQSLWQSFLHGNKPLVTFLLFLSNYAVLAYKDRKWLRFVPKAEFVLEIGEGYKFSELQSVTVADNNKANSNFKINVFVRLSDEVFKGQISAKDFQRYIDWKKLTAEQLLSPEAFESERLSHNRKRTIKSAAVLLYFFIAAILVIYLMQHLPQS